MYEIIAEPGTSLGVELFDRPINHPAHPRHRSEIWMVAQPDVKGINPIEVERDHRRSDRETVCRQPAHCQAADDRGIKSGADVGAHGDEASLYPFRILLIVQVMRLTLIREHQYDAVAFVDFLLGLWQAVGVDVGL